MDLSVCNFERGLFAEGSQVLAEGEVVNGKYRVQVGHQKYFA
jgi:hypothetical protein